jgi:hypothetical protein
MEILEDIKSLSSLNFSGKGEAFVESKFLTPLLGCLGYEDHNDYEVLRHGDDGASFKLSYPPVEKGATRVKHYNPDYVPTIRKNMFWIIEAKSPKSVDYPFDYKYVVQGLQYCIHPEIQAKYLVLSNGEHTCIYDPQSAVFSDGDMFEPIFEFKSNDLTNKWEEVYSILGVEKLRTRIEDYLTTQYEKLCLSSLDKNYPHRVANKITQNKRSLQKKIERNVGKLFVKNMDEEYEEWQKDLEKGPIRYLEICMEYPIRRGKEPSQHYVEQMLKSHKSDYIYKKLVTNYSVLSYFQKEHCFIALCYLYNLVESNDLVKSEVKSFLLEYVNEAISPLNKAEATLIRIIRKAIVIYAYPKLREEIAKKLESLPEIERFVNKPSASRYTYSNELKMHENYFAILKTMNEKQLNQLIPHLIKFEDLLEENFSEAQKAIPNGEREINGFEWYGTGDKIYSLKNIMSNFNIIPKDELNDLMNQKS